MMHEIRRWIALCESPQAEYFLHATSPQNIPSILKQGLVSNYSSNYDDVRWVSLNGVYASNQPSQIKQYVLAHGLRDDFAVVLIETHQKDARLPDEDLIDMILSKIAQSVFKTEDVEQIAEFHDHDDPKWQKVADQFHRIAGGGAKDARRLHDLVDYWADFEIYQGGDTDPYTWAELKDWATRRYPKMLHPHLGIQHSVRFPDGVGFSGPTRIVAILAVTDGEISVVYGTVPPAAETLVQDVQ